MSAGSLLGFSLCCACNSLCHAPMFALSQGSRFVLTTLGLTGVCPWHHCHLVTPPHEMLHQQDNSWREEHTRVPVHLNGNWNHQQQLNTPGSHLSLGKCSTYERQHEHVMTSSTVHCIWPEFLKDIPSICFAAEADEAEMLVLSPFQTGGIRASLYLGT